MKVLILTQYFWPETFRINEVVESLRDEGCHITVLTGQPNYPQGEVFPGYRANSLGMQRQDGYCIYRVPLAPRGRKGPLGLIANYLSFVLSASIFGPWLLRNQRFDVIFVYAPSPITQVIPAVLLASIKRARLITWVQDLWPQSLEVTGFVRNRHALNAVAVMVRWIYQRCDLLLTQSQAFIPMVKAMAGATAVRYHPNPGELAFGKELSSCEPALTLSPGFNVVFAGNLGTVQALETVLDAAELLLPHAGVRVVLVGSGSLSNWLAQQVADRRLNNVELPGRFPAQAMPGILAQASVLLVSLVHDETMSQTIPSKVQAYLAAGKPIIASLDGEGARIVEESGAGVACPAEDARALADAVVRLKGLSPDQLRHMGDAGVRYYKQHFDPTLLAKKLMREFSDLVGERRA